jgi:DNA-binding PadR family transcriptional regulator
MQLAMEQRMEIQSQLPLTEATLLILLSLVPQPRHGYAIMKEVEALSNGRIQLSTGTLYGAIKRMLDQGWIERYDETVVDGRSRKAYRLTDIGQRILEAELARMQSLIAVSQQRTAVSKT